MGRFTLVGLLLSLLAAAAPQTAPLKITVTITAADGSTRPVPRHALLISDDPVTSSPHRFVTRSDGTAEAYLKPGKYTVESDDPFVFEGKAYAWSQPVNVAASGTELALTAANATIEAAKPGAGAAPSARRIGDSAEDTLLADWQASIMTIWTPRSVGRGFLVDARGMVATNQRVVGSAVSVEVQFSATKKIAGRVLASDPDRNVAVVWIDPQAAASAKPMKLATAKGDKAAVAEREKIYAIEAPSIEARNIVSGIVTRVTPHAIASSVQLDRESAGVPLITAGGEVVAITTTSDEAADVDDVSPLAVPIDDLQGTLAAAAAKLGPAPPAATPLPVEPATAVAEDALRSAAKSLRNPLAYVAAATDFDVAIITPPALYSSRHRDTDSKQFEYGGNPTETQPAVRALDDFGVWNGYVSDVPPVLLIRVTPKLAESFWTTVARGAAQTQGVAIPAIKKPKAAFGALRLACGDTDIAPIHPFRIGHRVEDGTSVDEGLYVFPPSAISPQCGTVKITVFTEKAPDRGDTRTIDPKIVQHVWDDFAFFRAANDRESVRRGRDAHDPEAVLPRMPRARLVSDR
ncbi:MAG TPA: S1C family serine protease [Vicinamibacterales bacterium]